MSSEIKHRKSSTPKRSPIDIELGSNHRRSSSQHRRPADFVVKRIIWALALLAVAVLLYSYLLPSRSSTSRKYVKSNRHTSVSVSGGSKSSSHLLPFSKFIANNHVQALGYGKTPLTGVYTFDNEDFLLQKSALTGSETGSIRFPLVDISSLIAEESETAEYQQMQLINRFGQSTFDQPQSKNDKESLLNEDSSFKSAIANLITSFPNDRALLTRCGYKPGKIPNQDRSFIANFDIMDTYDRPQLRSALLLGIFDGHGPRGHEVSHYIALEFARSFATIMRQKQKDNQSIPLIESLGDRNEEEDGEVVTYIRQALVETFLKVDENEPVKGVGGSTASTLFYPGLESKLYIANCGDSTTLIAKYSKSKGTSEVVFQNKKHKPHLPEERERIEKSGGHVMIPPSLMEGGVNNGPIAETSRLIIPDKNGSPFGGLALAMSRSIGDYDGKHVGLIAEPTVDVWDVNDYYEDHHFSGAEKDDTEWFAVIASDGIYDVLPPEVVVEYLGHSLYPDKTGAKLSPMEACERLIREASRLWLKASMGGMSYRDDITLGVSKINFDFP